MSKPKIDDQWRNDGVAAASRF